MIKPCTWKSPPDARTDNAKRPNFLTAWILTWFTIIFWKYWIKSLSIWLSYFCLFRSFSLSFYQVKLSTKERQGLDGKEIQKAQMALWRKIRTTNLIERAFREVKRRTRPMGVFGNRDSMERILYAVFFHLNSKGQEIPSLLFTQNAWHKLWLLFPWQKSRFYGSVALHNERNLKNFPMRWVQWGKWKGSVFHGAFNEMGVQKIGWKSHQESSGKFYERLLFWLFSATPA